jgi:hypothetical protein
LSVPAITSAASIELVISGNDVLDCEGIAYQERLVLGVAPSTTFLLQLDNENSTHHIYTCIFRDVPIPVFKMIRWG